MIARIALAGVLAGSAVAKLVAPRSSRAALATFSVADPRAQSLIWGVLVAAELALAAGVAGGSAAAAYLAAGMLLLFALALVGASLRGRAGAPCACFGARSTVGWRGIVRNLALAAALAALPLLPEPTLSTDEWLGLGLGVALALSLGLTVARASAPSSSTEARPLRAAPAKTGSLRGSRYPIERPSAVAHEPSPRGNSTPARAPGARRPQSAAPSPPSRVLT